MHRIVRYIRDNMEFLELPGGGMHHSFPAERFGGRGRVDEVEDDLVSFRDPGHRAGPGGSTEALRTQNTNLVAYPRYRLEGGY